MPTQTILLAGLLPLAAALIACGGEGTIAPAAAPVTPLRSIVSPMLVQEHLSAKAPILLIDTRTTGDYEQGHLPGAISLPLDSVLPLARAEFDPADRLRVLSALGSAGIREDFDVVVVDGGSREGFFRAASACWTLMLADAENCHVMEGGLAGWQKIGGPLEKAAGAPGAYASLKIPDRPLEWTDLQQLRETIIHPETVLLDVREEPGGEEIPGALRVLPLRSVGPDGRVDRVELQRLVEESGLFVEAHSVILGDGLVDGAAAWFLLQQGLGIQGVSLFPGGVQLYKTYPNLPIRGAPNS